MKSAKELFEQAVKITTTGERQLNYGSPEDSFNRIAELWSHYINNRKKKGDITPFDVALMMVYFKLARWENEPTHEDTVVDIFGYILCALQILEKQSPKESDGKKQFEDMLKIVDDCLTGIKDKKIYPKGHEIYSKKEDSVGEPVTCTFKMEL